MLTSVLTAAPAFDMSQINGTVDGIFSIGSSAMDFVTGQPLLLIGFIGFPLLGMAVGVIKKFKR